MNSRIKDLRLSKGMTQEEMGKWLGISKSGVSDIESGRRKVTEQHIIMLVNHGVNEEWLRTGTGEMFIKMSRDEEIAGFIGTVLKDEESTFKKRFIKMLASLSEDEWELLEQKARELVDGNE